MASFRLGKEMIGAGTYRDTISHLPGEIKEKILTKMPIKDAVRTSILSTKWRNTWTAIPEIVVKDDELITTVDGCTQSASSNFVRNVDLLILNHHGPILKFDLTTRFYCPEAFNQWILHLSRNRITELTFVLNLASTTKYMIPSILFSCDALQYIELCRCSVNLPHGFEGFKFLRTLILKRCTISADDLELLVSTSPNLVHLELKFYHVRDEPRIVSKGLTNLIVWGDFPDITIDSPNLTFLVIGFFNYNNTSPARVKCINNFCASLGILLNMRKIGFIGSSIPHLANRSPAVLLNSCSKTLFAVALEINLADQKESDFAFSLLWNAANLQYLIILVQHRSEGATVSSLWEKDIICKSLREVYISKFNASEPVFAFVRFILRSTPNLRKLTLKEDPNIPKERYPEILKHLLTFERASPRAEVIFR